MMLWTWVGDIAKEIGMAGHAQAAEAVRSMPQLAVDGDVARLNAGLPSALRAADDVSGRPWLRSYMEHWPLAARVGDRAEGESARAEAEDRLRVAHGHETGCTPAACAAESLLACYATTDGPGNADDRVAVVTEALETTSPGEPAWEALVRAHADTLVDDERPDEAVCVLDSRVREARDSGAEVSLDYGFGYARALYQQDQYTEALGTLDHMEANLGGGWPRGIPRDVAQRRIRFERARVLAWLVRTGERSTDEAVAALPALREADAHPTHRAAWVDATENLIVAGALRNDWHVGVALTAWARYYEQVGAWRPALEISLSAARLAILRGARWVAESALGRAHRMLGEVRQAEKPTADLTEARLGVQGLPALDLGVPADQVIALLREEPPEQVNPERQADYVIAALDHRPGDPTLLNALGQVGRTLMLPDAAADLHWRRVRTVPGDEKAALSLLETLLYDNDAPGMRTLVRTLAGAAVVDSEPAG